MVRTDSWRGRIALMAGHCAGMIDLVALPVWVGALIAHYGFDPQQAGGLVTLFLAGAVLASVMLAPRFGRLNGRVVAACGFGVAAAAFAAAAQTRGFGALAALHVLAGLAAGSALSVTHGTLARSANPHRQFALVNFALGVFAILFLGGTPKLIEAAGAPMLFVVFAAVMAVGALLGALAFPVLPPAVVLPASGAPQGAPRRFPPAVWAGIFAIFCMGLVQSMTFAFLERAGADRGYGVAQITGVLIALGFVNLLPAPLAAWLQHRLRARGVLIAGPLVQAAVCALIMTRSSFQVYAAAACVFAAIIIFTHTFAFGLLARLEPSGRALAATPAMLMVGAAIGPILGGTFVKFAGYGAIAVVAAGLGLGAAVAVAALVPAQARQAHVARRAA
ncbi:MAG: MFS transporter [Rubrivivax sp.]|nr:MFS transporter [Rubrivivax sp.]